MNETETLSRSLQRYTGVLRRQWWVTALVTVVAVAAAGLYVAQATPIYAASSKVVVGQGQSLFNPDLSVDYTAFTSTISSLLQSNVVAQDTIHDLGLHMTPTSLLNNLSVNAQPAGAVINVSYNDPDQARAVRILSTIGSVFTTLINTKLATKTTGTGATASPPVSAAVFDPAHPVPGKVSPHTTRTIAIALVLGLVAGLVLAFLRDAFSSAIKSEEDASTAYEASSIGAVPRGALGVGIFELPTLPRATSVRIADAYQMLVARLRYTTSLQRGVIVVIGARPEDGKTTTTAHIAAVLSAADNDVIAVEADLHRPALHRLFGVSPGQPGIVDLEAPGSALTSDLVTVDRRSASTTAPSRRRLPAITGGRAANEPPADAGNGSSDFEPEETAIGRLRLLPAGTPGKRAVNALSLENASSLITRLRALADYVVVDTAPLLLSADAYPLIQLADAVVVVCRRGATRHAEAARARDILRSLGVREYSLVLTESDVPTHEYYGYAES